MSPNKISFHQSSVTLILGSKSSLKNNNCDEIIIIHLRLCDEHVRSILAGWTVFARLPWHWSMSWQRPSHSLTKIEKSEHVSRNLAAASVISIPTYLLAYLLQMCQRHFACFCSLCLIPLIHRLCLPKVISSHRPRLSSQTATVCLERLLRRHFVRIGYRYRYRQYLHALMPMWECRTFKFTLKSNLIFTSEWNPSSCRDQSEWSRSKSFYSCVFFKWNRNL